LFHHVCRTHNRRALWSSWPEGVWLWRRIIRHCPQPIALVLMPDHVHLLHTVDVRRRLARALADYGQWWSHRHGRRWPGMQRLPPAEYVPDGKKRRRSIRYVHLNPCRNPYEFHAYVSSDPSVAVHGSPMPSFHLGERNLEDLLAAASAACRAPVSELRMRGPARTVFLRAARTLTTATARQIGVVGGVHNTTVLRAPHRSDRSTQVIEQVASDPRFAPLTEEDLRTRLTWRRYA
jgi:hypothetical protein